MTAPRDYVLARYSAALHFIDSAKSEVEALIESSVEGEPLADGSTHPEVTDSAIYSLHSATAAIDRARNTDIEEEELIEGEEPLPGEEDEDQSDDANDSEPESEETDAA